ncbi:MAG: LD-carboxypeptidase [Prolixibacteraceae bacterium]
MMKIPPYLKKGDLIGIVSSASKIDQLIVEPAVELLRSLGFRVELGQHIFAQHHQFAGSDEERAADLQYMVDHKQMKAIVFSRGGYGTLRTLQSIDWKLFQQKPKWLIGFSDVTVLHSQLNQLKIASIHGVMPRYFYEENKATESFNTLLNVLKGKVVEYHIEPSTYNKAGHVSGEVIGGNLSILYSLRGTSMDIDTKGKILFIEDLSEYLYHLDRMMMNLKIGQKLERLRGLIVGGFSGMKDNGTPYGKTVEEIILDAVADYNYPVVFDFPAGHQANNFAIKLGCHATMTVDSHQVIFQQ